MSGSMTDARRPATLDRIDGPQKSLPAATATHSCVPVATVIPHAPASSWRRQRSGAIVVLPCGARRTPADRAQSAITDMFDSSAARSTVSNGVDNRSRVGSVRKYSRAVWPHASRGRPLCCGPITRSSSAATAPLLITCKSSRVAYFATLIA